MEIGRIGHVLLVDHEASARETTGHFLECAGFAVQAVSGSAEAILQLNNGTRPAIVLADCDSPSISGVQLLDIIGRRWGFIPVVLFSRAMTPELRVQFIGQGADVCFDKPINIPNLVAFLRERMGQLEPTPKKNVPSKPNRSEACSGLFRPARIPFEPKMHHIKYNLGLFYIVTMCHL